MIDRFVCFSVRMILNILSVNIASYVVEIYVVNLNSGGWCA